MRNVLLDVWVLAGVCLQVIQLAGTDLQKAQITRHEAGATEAEWAAYRTYNPASQGHWPWQTYHSDRTGGDGCASGKANMC